ncbi:gpd1 [Ecytonucleospora hepatopenaei]|uniref:Glycerol-3-phosphate dehydrogenase [NAD(+)] n=1 Tax=Ecytonucleospora hepatopenaei TaxID=646526 RepID=A0A1W0E9A9_9MICR|nr:gpd1 [Ecytonucleospora hepatopenaei]
MKHVAVLGCGNWGTTIANLLATDIDVSIFDNNVKMYVHETELEFEGKTRKLSEIINNLHINPKYLPDVKLSENVVAVTNFVDLKNTDVLIVCVPHQFLHTVREVYEVILKKEELIVINLAKGLVFEEKLSTPSEFVSHLINKKCSTLQGANIAHEIANKVVAETLIGYHDEFEKRIFKSLFVKPYFQVKFVKYNPTIDVYGALKNVVSFAYGIIEGIIESQGKENEHDKIVFGSNTKVIVLRRGISEILKFIEEEGYKGGKELFLETCGIADLIVSCEKGRNKQCGKMVCEAVKSCQSEKGMLSDILEEKFNGQKIQGMDTVKILYEYLKSKNRQNDFLMIKMVYELLFETCDLSPVYEFI